MRKVIADRMSQSAFTAPHVTLTSEIDMTKAKEVRKQLLPAIEKRQATDCRSQKLSFMRSATYSHATRISI